MVRQRNIELRSKVAAISAAWRTDALQWYGRRFNLRTMDRVCEACPDTFGRWFSHALADSQPAANRLRLGSFLDSLCRVLFDRKSDLGLQLWSALRDHVQSSVVFATRDIAFRAADSRESELARATEFEESWNDGSIADIAFSAGAHKRQAWLDKVVEESIRARQLWKRAKGLTLASLSDITPERFEDLVATAAVGHSWVERTLAYLRENVCKNHLAKHWYRSFLSSENSDSAWAALQLVLTLADERLLNWRANVEEECSDQDRTRERLRFLDLGWASGRELRKELSRSDKRKKTLFGIDIPTGEIFPFMDLGFASHRNPLDLHAGLKHDRQPSSFE